MKQTTRGTLAFPIAAVLGTAFALSGIAGADSHFVELEDDPLSGCFGMLRQIEVPKHPTLTHATPWTGPNDGFAVRVVDKLEVAFFDYQHTVEDDDGGNDWHVYVLTGQTDQFSCLVQPCDEDAWQTLVWDALVDVLPPNDLPGHADSPCDEPAES